MPFAIAAGLVAALSTITGVIEAQSKREISGSVFANALNVRQAMPPGVPQEAYDACYDQLEGGTVNISGPFENNAVRIDGVPPACMNLATVLLGNPVDGPYPIPLGSDSLEYQSLTVDQLNELRAIVDGAR